MSLYVIDAGVAAKWFIEEPDSEQAKKLLTNYFRWIDDLIAPDLIIAEVANVFWKRAARGDLTAKEAKDSLTDLLSLNVPLISSALLASKALLLAQDHQRSVYDCLYLTLALERGCNCITSDERLHNAIGQVFPQLILLRDLSL
jgi:predicted nucleic acid-binding protein